MFHDLQTWWTQASSLIKFYWIIAVPCTLLFLIQMLLTFVGGDVDTDGMLGDAELPDDIPDAGAFQLFTVKNLIGFFTIFSWSGLASLYSGLSATTSIVVSLVCGIAMMLLMAGIFYFMSRLAYSGTFQIKNCIGALGEVYLTVPAQRGGLGKINVKVQGALRELEALTDEEVALEQGSLVKVTQVINDQALLVTKYK